MFRDDKKLRTTAVTIGSNINKFAPGNVFTDVREAKNAKAKHEILKNLIENKKSGFVPLNRFSYKGCNIYSRFPDEYNKAFASGEYPKNIDMARKLTKQGYDVFLMSNPNNTRSFDFVLRRNGKYIDIEGKASNGKNSLDHLFDKGAKQSNRIVIDIIGNKNTNYILSNIKIAFKKYDDLYEVWMLKGSRLIKITRQMFLSKDFDKNFKRNWRK